MPKKNVKIKIQSKICDLTGNDMVQNILNDEEFMSFMDEGNIIDDTIEFSTDATLRDINGHIELVYNELEELGMEKSRTKLMFDKTEPTSVTMVRTGAVATGMVFNSAKGKRRYICTYETNIMPFEICVCTRSIDNKLTYDNGGTMYLDYDIEIHGIKTERNRFTIEVTNQSAEGRLS